MTDTKQIFLIGIKSGAKAGIIGATIFGVFVDVVLLASFKSIVMLYYIIPLLIIGIPIGLLGGAIIGLLMSYFISKGNITAQNITISSIFIGSLAGIIYPLLLIVLNLVFQETIDQEEIQEITFTFIGGLLSGGIAGLLGSKAFFRYLNE